MTLLASLMLAVAVSPSLPGIPPSPPATPGMVDAVTAHRTRLLNEWLEELNGPYREVHTSHTNRGTFHTNGPAIDIDTSVGTGMGSDVEQWRPLVEAYFGAQTDAALRVMRCESGGNPSAQHPRSHASGLFQFLPSTFAVWGVGDVFDPAANVAAAAALSAGGTNWGPWTCKP